MNSISLKIVFCILIYFLISCATSNTRSNEPERVIRPYEQKTSPSDNVVGTVEVRFESPNNDWDTIIHSSTRELAYFMLLEQAKKEYSNDAEVKNISISMKTWSKASRQGTFVANGLVVTPGDSGSRRRTVEGIEGALERAAEQTLINVPSKAIIAIVYITAQDQSTADFIAGELEYIWVNGGFTITDRSQLDRLRREQDFQFSGEVDDETAVSIGKFAGADFIVTGRVDGEGNLCRLRLRAINTQSAQVVGVASERI